MKTKPYRNINNEKGVEIMPEGASSGVRVRSNPDNSYVAVWPIRFVKAETAVRHALSVLPKPTREDHAVILGNGKQVDLSARRLLGALEGSKHPNPRIVRVELGAASLTWAAWFDGERGQMSFSDEVFDREVLHPLLRETGQFPKGFNLHSLLDIASDTLVGK